MQYVDENEQLRRDRERTANEAIDSLRKSNEELLKEIFFCANDNLGHNPSTMIGDTIAHFSSLLINLSKKAEESTNENIKMQRTITMLTKIMLFVSVVLLFISAVQVYQSVTGVNNQCQTCKNRNELNSIAVKPSVPQNTEKIHK